MIGHEFSEVFVNECPRNLQSLSGEDQGGRRGSRKGLHTRSATWSTLHPDHPAMTSSCLPKEKQGVGSRSEDQGSSGRRGHVSPGAQPSCPVRTPRPPFACGWRRFGRDTVAALMSCGVKPLPGTALSVVADPGCPPPSAPCTRRRERESV